MEIRTYGLLAGMAATLVMGCGDGVEYQNTGGAGGSGSGGSGQGGSDIFTGKDPAGAKDPGDALKAAVILGSCVPDDGIVRNLIRMYTERGRTEDVVLTEFTKCLASAGGGCKAVEACLGVTIDVAPAGCMASCAGNTLTVCGDGMKFTADCAKFDLQCSTTEANCVSKTPGPACDFGTFMESCKNGAPLVCGSANTEQPGPSCGDFGLTCAVDMNGFAACVGAGAACMPTSTTGREIDFSQGISCNGAKLNTCMNGFAHEVDCGTIVNGFTCQTVGMTSFCGQAAECAPDSSVKATCEGDNVVLCNAGRMDKVDCKSLGFVTCNAKFGTCSPSVHDKF